MAGVISTSISGSVQFEFDNVDDLRRFLAVLDAGLVGRQLFNEDIQELADEIRTLIDKVS